MNTRTLVGLAASLFGLFALGCSSPVGTEEPRDDDEQPILDTNGNEVITSKQDSYVKTSTQHSSQLPASDKCLLPAGTQVTIRADTTQDGSYLRARLVSRLPGCAQAAFKPGARDVYLFAGHYTGLSTTPPPPAPPNVTLLPTCSPERAVGAVGRYGRALLDAIAWAEGTRGAGGKDGYNVLFSFKTTTSCKDHPRRTICSGICSSAAGRYQFLSTTWDGLKLPTFEPENQDKGGLVLVGRRGVAVPGNRPMTATEFHNAMSRLSYEWASLPPGRYGQPVKTESQLRADYCAHAGGC